MHPKILTTSLGIVAVVDVDPDARAFHTLPGQEQALAAGFGARRKATFCAGRRALRAALVAAGVAAHEDDVGPLLRDDRGAPLPPSRFLPASSSSSSSSSPSSSREGCVRVSVTHKDTHAAALVTLVDDVRVHVGLDLECDERLPRTRIDAIARHALRPPELAALPDDELARRRAVLVAFSAKEALYKAIDKTLRRYVGFQEVGVSVHGADLGFLCPVGSRLAAKGVVVDVGDDGLILTICHARPVTDANGD